MHVGNDQWFLLIEKWLTFGFLAAVMSWLKPLILFSPFTVSVFPVITFSFGILKSTQLSFFKLMFSLRLGFADVSRGESHSALKLGFIFSSFSSTSSSSEVFSFSKKGCFRASSAEILCSGFFFNIFSSKSRVSLDRCLNQSPLKFTLAALFWLSTSLQVLPGKALFPITSRQKMSPKLKMSQMGLYLVDMSLMLMTSGATYPGVPHRTNKYSETSWENSASPKSAITQSQSPCFFLNSRFSGLRSLCMIFFSCISLSPNRIPRIILVTSWCLNLYLDLTLSQSCPPSRSSNTIQREFSDSKTSYSFMQFLWLKFLITQISFIKHYFPFSSLQAASFENAFTAQFFLSSNFCTKYTDAKFPLPIL